jgi:hypothetical protein
VLASTPPGEQPTPGRLVRRGKKKEEDDDDDDDEEESPWQSKSRTCNGSPP